MRPELVRAGAVYLPLLATLALVAWRRPGRADVAGAVAAVAWNLPAVLALNVVALRVGWWSFDAPGGNVLGVPADLWLGWALLWGAVPVLAGTRSTPHAMGAVVAGLVAADLVLMPLAHPVVRLHRTWLAGEALGAAACLVPGALLGHWTRSQTRVRARAAMLAAAFGGLLLFVVPALAFSATGHPDGWGELLSRRRWHVVVGCALVSPFAAMALQAVREFAVVGGGTPVPLDPPARLVTTGPYAYVRNPMQLGGTVVLLAWGALLASAWVAAAGLAAAAFSAGIAAWTEEGELAGRHGAAWADYRRRVRPWLPRWRPAASGDARTLVAATCDPCSEVGGFLQRRGVWVEAAEDVDRSLTRIAYVDGPVREQGVAAIARSLEQVHLGWAAAGWVARLPVVSGVLQLIADAVGAGPRPLPPAAPSGAGDHVLRSGHGSGDRRFSG